MSSSPKIDDALRVPLLVAYGAGSYLLAASTLQFLATILLNIVDAAYTCHALDLESNMCHQPKMKAAIMGVVSPTAVVQQPGGAPPVVAVPAVPCATAPRASPPPAPWTVEPS